MCNREDSNRAAAHSAASKATVRLCLARGSQRVGMSNKRTTVHSGKMELAKNPLHTFVCRGFFLCNREDSNSAAAHSAASKATVRLCLARGFQPVGMSNKRTTVHPGEMELAKNPRHTFVCRGFFLCDREDSNSNDDDRSRRLKQGGVVGAAF